MQDLEKENMGLRCEIKELKHQIEILEQKNNEIGFDLNTQQGNVEFVRQLLQKEKEKVAGLEGELRTYKNLFLIGTIQRSE